MPRRNGVFILEPVIERIDLPAPFEGLWVEMNVTPSTNDLKKWEGEEAGLTGLMSAIKNWNLVDGKDKPLPLNIDTMRLLPIKLVGVLRDEFSERALGVPKATADA